MASDHESTEKQPLHTITDEYIVTERRLPRRSFLTSGGVLLAGAAGMVSSVSGLAQSQDDKDRKKDDTKKADNSKKSDDDASKANDKTQKSDKKDTKPPVKPPVDDDDQGRVP